MTGENITLPNKLLKQAAARGDQVAVRHKQRGIWREFSWQDYANQARLIGLGLAKLGVETGEKVAVHAENRPEWIFSDLGIQGIGAVTVGIYPTSPAAEVLYLLQHSEAKVVIAEDEEQLDKAMAVWDQLSNLAYAVVMDPRGVRSLDDPRVLTYQQLLDLGSQENMADFDASVANLANDDVAIIVYTSGTTGPPKGAMLNHINLHAASREYDTIFSLSNADDVLSYLPLCHIAERLVTVINGIAAGYTANFGEGGEAFANDLREVQPTFFLGVPRVWEKMLANIQIRMNDASWFKRTNYQYWTKVGSKFAKSRMNNQLSWHGKVFLAVGSLMLFRALRERLGMSRCRHALSGAAPIAPQILEWLWTIGVPVKEAYGQTENCAQATVNPNNAVKIGTVGLPVPGTEISIASDGEILTRGDATFVGYFKNSQATGATINGQGWLHTGDVGEIDEDGYLTITDRKKDIIITAGGKNISPSEIENRLKVSPFVREAVVVGDRRKYLSALLGIEYQTVGDWATRKGITYTTYADLSQKPAVRSLIEDVVNETNQEFARVETIKRFELMTVELDHEDGQLTATQKVKRSAITSQFEELIAKMYQ